MIAAARRELPVDPELQALEAEIYALDSTTIDLCLKLFPWARFRRRKAAVKLHTLMDLRVQIPVFIAVSDGKFHEVNTLDTLHLQPGSYVVFDKGYVNSELPPSPHFSQPFTPPNSPTAPPVQLPYPLHPILKNTTAPSGAPP